MALDNREFTLAFGAAVDEFSWRRFAAIQIWLFTCFLIYVTATELSALLGEGQLFRLFFRHRSSQHRLTRRQHVRALMELSRLAETTPRDKLLDPATPQGNRLVTIVTPCAGVRLGLSRDRRGSPRWIRRRRGAPQGIS